MTDAFALTLAQRYIKENIHAATTQSLEAVIDSEARNMRRETHDALITAAPLNLMAVTLGRADPAYQPGDRLPAPWHWLYFLPAARA